MGIIWAWVLIFFVPLQHKCFIKVDANENHPTPLNVLTQIPFPWLVSWPLSRALIGWKITMNINSALPPPNSPVHNEYSLYIGVRNRGNKIKIQFWTHQRPENICFSFFLNICWTESVWTVTRQWLAESVDFTGPVLG